MARKKNRGKKQAQKLNAAADRPSKSKPDKRTEKPVPVLIDFTISVAKVIVVLIGAISAVLSYLAGCSLLIIALRAGAAMLAVGLILWLLNWVLSRNALDTIRLEIINAQKAASKSPSTIDREA